MNGCSGLRSDIAVGSSIDFEPTTRQTDTVKIIVASIGMLTAALGDAHAKAVFFTKAELIQKASVIAIITIDEPQPAVPAGGSDPFEVNPAATKLWIYGKKAKVRVEKVLKGKAPKEFVLHGDESFICASCVLSKGRFLGFLTKDESFWVGVNWQSSLRPIRDNEVEWYADEQRSPTKFQPLDGVIQEIQALLQTPSSETKVEEKSPTSPVPK